MHIGQEEGHPDAQHHRRRHSQPVVHPAPEQEARRQQGQGQRPGGQDAQQGEVPGVLSAVGQELVDGGGVEHQAAAVLPHLVEVNAQNVPQGLAQQEGGDDGDQVGEGKDPQLPELHPARQPQHPPQGQQEDGLELEAEGQGHEGHRGLVPPVQHAGGGVDAKRAVNAVALAPEGPVQHRRGQQQGGGKGDQGSRAPLAFPGQGTHQPVTAPGQDHVEDNGEQLDQVQVGGGEVGDEGHKIKVGHVIIPHGVGHRLEAAVLLEVGVPVGEEVFVVCPGVVQAQGPEQHGRADGQQQDQQRVPPAALPPEQGQGQRGQQ